jgi:hypothetical protein
MTNLVGYVQGAPWLALPDIGEARFRELTAEARRLEVRAARLISQNKRS